ncbi:MAG: hypothetical protein AAGA12_00065 [Pseudomonadota bacterium]
MTTGRELAELDIRLAEAKFAWQRRIYGHALEATIADDKDSARTNEKVLKDIRDLGEDVSFRISQFLYHLSAYEMDSGKELERRMRAQNESLEALCNDPNYQLRTGYKLDRLRSMRFSENTIEHAAMIVDYYKRPVINETVLAGFLVRLAGKSNINRCLKIFEKTKLIEIKQGPSNSKLIFEFGKLVDAYEAYLKDVSAAVEADKV